jgi:hypothetical protein
MGLLRSDNVGASDHSATRSFSASSVPVGGELEITIVTTGSNRFGQVVETLPAGFSYVPSDLSDHVASVDTGDQTVTFTLFPLAGQFTYKVTVSDEAEVKVHEFKGVVVDQPAEGQPLDERTVGDDYEVTVTPQAGDVGGETPTPSPSPSPEPGSPSAARSFSPSPVGPGDPLKVTITLPDYGAVGEWVETLPDGFIYVSTDDSTDHDDVVQNGQMLSFSLVGEESFYYIVTAPSPSTARDYTFRGTLTDSDRRRGTTPSVGPSPTATGIHMTL